LGGGGLLGEGHGLGLLDGQSLLGNWGSASLLLEDQCGFFLIRLTVVIRPVLLVNPISDGIAGFVLLVWVLLSFFFVHALHPGSLPLGLAMLRRGILVLPAFFVGTGDYQPLCILSEPGFNSVTADLVILVFVAVNLPAPPFRIAHLFVLDRGVEIEACLRGHWIESHFHIPFLHDLGGLLEGSEELLGVDGLGLNGSRCLECSVLAHGGNSLFQAGSFHCLVPW